MSHHCNQNPIVSAAIYPPIGVMRVGNSPDEFFIGPEVDTLIPRDTQYYRDRTGALKRQAARFRIYGLDAEGNVVKELVSDEQTSITWRARLANQKASWYEFQLALDIPEAAEADPSLLRNLNVEDRNALLIDGGECQISGTSSGCGCSRFEGRFQGKKVYLGEMRTDEQGRLIMLGGHGVSENPQGHEAVTFGNNEGWYDDTSDGPVMASVEYQGKCLTVKPAWVICAPPDYAPMQKSPRTMWDLMRQVAVDADMLPAPSGKPSFSKDILPIFQRMTNLQWVNAGFAAGFGWHSPFDFTSKEWISRLNDNSDTWREARRNLFNNFRQVEKVEKITPEGKKNVWDPQFAASAPQLWPWLYGDAMSVDADDSPRQFVTLTDIQLHMLQQWSNGDFESDYDPKYQPPMDLDDVPLAQQPDMLTKAAMEFCLADAFHPGCEMTWPMRTAGLYSEAFRLNHAQNTAPTHGTNYGVEMTPAIALHSSGPILTGQVAGGITRWMAIPWQTDTASCRDGYNAAYDPYLPTFWPARVPNNVLTEQNYHAVIDECLSPEVRQAAFNDRALWLDDLPIPPDTKPKELYQAQINSMVSNFADLAVVLPKSEPGVTGFPTTMQVGIAPHTPVPQTEKLMTSGHGKQGVRPDLSQTDKAHRRSRKR
ncbi:LodA/GoxA family CTQ-dependent oxidase [Pseudoalteromonas peptidolytica]|uniref:L-lysine 6-oxidase n=1 Tax=Pseudoalteromonas peptidolytica F12-50-A1 TaxID=1315280 RepID=A0A8I0T4I6_9GAMM|nr:LodA/GoxA family CTQ-dependent oxidase [Pseudoalteromonas peptidolytica]MBE0347010.1 hypothetical protein [Pseudoalteromonas peptidolytica F12-50-A1]NLR14065.1 hypothetical protein [Pseudoalteromonas peptidolytica]GEK09111.1 3-isopropylmalate dehydrogenase [Pseudoalteromonas peptidolytica]